MRVGDLVEYSYLFDSEAIDHWTADNKICFVVLREKDEQFIWAKPQFPLNNKGKSVLAIAADSEYPGTRDGYWLLEKNKCRIIRSLYGPHL